MHGGVILFRGTGADAMRYVEADRSRADDYYLSDGAGIAYAVLDASGTAVKVRPLSNEEYAGWVDWIHPDTGERMGTPRLAGRYLSRWVRPVGVRPRVGARQLVAD